MLPHSLKHNNTWGGGMMSAYVKNQERGAEKNTPEYQESSL